MGSISLFASVINWGWLRIGPPYIYINIDPVIVQVGPFALHWYGLMYVVAILVGFFVAQRYEKVGRPNITQALTACILHLVRDYLEGDRRSLIAAYEGEDLGLISCQSPPETLAALFLLALLMKS